MNQKLKLPVRKDKRRFVIAGVLIFAGVGSLLLYRSFAAEGNFYAQEAEYAITTGGSIEYDPDASQESFFRFNAVCPEGQIGQPPNCEDPPVIPDFTVQRREQVVPFEPPIHYLDTYWSLDTSFDRVEVDVRPEVAAVSSDGYYVSNTVFFPIQPSCDPNCVAYMGLQTDGMDGRPGGGWMGKMAVFSMWGAPQEAVTGPGAWLVPFDGEGEGYSVRIPYDWHVNTTYRFVMYRDESIVPGVTYWTAYIVNVDADQWTYIGSIRAPAGLRNASSFVTFHEIYKTGGTCSTAAPSQFFISNARVALDGAWYDVKKRDHYQANVQDCNSTFWVNDYNGSNGFRSGVNTNPM